MNELLQHYWAQLVTGTAVVAAFVRSEARGRQNERAIDKLETRLEKQRLEDREQTHRDYADLREMMREMQQDIKKLLQRET